jgi:hypothetical protein
MDDDPCRAARAGEALRAGRSRDPDAGRLDRGRKEEIMELVGRITRYLLLGAVLGSLAAGPAAAEEEGRGATRAFERLKALAGKWEGRSTSGKKSFVVFELTAGGRTLLETYEEENGGDYGGMLTAFHLDGDRLMLTHFCVAGNQPRMIAEPFVPDSRELRFEFHDATNLPSPDAGHMHRAYFRFDADDTFFTEWTYYVKGKPSFSEKLTFTRVR